MVQSLAKVEYGYTYQPTAFSPPPKVKSAIVRFGQKNIADLNVEVLERICKAAFAQRRKTIKANLKVIFPNIDDILQELRLDPKLRAENLNVADFYNLTNLYIKHYL